MDALHGLALAEVHVDAAGQTRVEAPHGAHDVDAAEALLVVLLEDLLPLHRVLVGAGRAVEVARARVPRGRRGRGGGWGLSPAGHEGGGGDAPPRPVGTAAP